MKQLWRVTLWCILIACICLCSAEGSVTVTDDLGREVTLEKPAEKIAFEHYAPAEAIKIVGAWDKLVARDGYITDPEFFPDLDKIPAISPVKPTGKLDLDYEKIYELKPDLMIIQKQDWNNDQYNDLFKKLEPEIPVVILDFIDPLTQAESIEKLGKLTGTETSAQAYASFVRGITSDINAKTSILSDEEKPDVFFKGPAYKPEQIFTYGNGMKLWANMLNLAGGRNAVDNQSAAWFEVDSEWLIKKPIDIMVVHNREAMYPDVFGYNAKDQDAAKEKANSLITNLTSNPVFSGNDAVKNQKIYLIADPLTGTPRSIIGVAYLAKWFHPDLFNDLNPEEIHQKYLDFIGANYDLKNTGLFGYPGESS